MSAIGKTEEGQAADSIDRVLEESERYYLEWFNDLCGTDLRPRAEMQREIDALRSALAKTRTET